LATTLLTFPRDRGTKPNVGCALLAIDQELGEGAALRVAPELSDPVGPLEVGQHQNVEQFGAGSRPEGIQALL